MSTQRFLPFFFAGLLGASVAPGQDPGDVQGFAISHVRQLATEPPTLRVFLDVSLADETRSPDVQRDQISATLAELSLPVVELRPFSAILEGIGYIFLVDISRSLTEREFGEITAAMNGWIANLGTKDRVALISFGNVSRVVADWTSDFAAVRQALSQLGPTDSRTLFYEALAQAAELGERRDDSLPGRRVAVVLSDGRDEGSGLALEDVLGTFRRDPLPIYTIGFSRLEGANRQRYLDVLLRLSSNTGGSFYEASRTDFSEAYHQIGRAIERVWVSDLDCSRCTADGSLQRLQVALRAGDKVFSKGFDVRVLPPLGTSGAPGPAASRSRDVVVTRPADVGPVAARRVPRQARIGFWTLLGLALTLLVAAAALAMRRKRATAVASSAPASFAPPVQPTIAPGPVAPSLVAPTTGARANHPESGGGAPLPPDFGPSTALDFENARAGISLAQPTPSPAAIQAAWAMTEQEPLDPTVPRIVRFHVVRGNTKGRQLRCVMKRTLVVGSRSNCDLVVPDEPNLDAEQFSIEQDGDALFLRNRSTRRVTLLNGLPLAQDQPLQSGDLIGNGDVILRFMIGGG